MSDLERRFHDAMVDIYRRARSDCYYHASRFVQMVGEIGGLETARRLLSTDEMQSGLYELWRCGKPEISVEYLVLQPEWQDLFTEEHRARARARLKQLGFEVRP